MVVVRRRSKRKRVHSDNMASRDISMLLITKYILFNMGLSESGKKTHIYTCHISASPYACTAKAKSARRLYRH